MGIVYVGVPPVSPLWVAGRGFQHGRQGSPVHPPKQGSIDRTPFKSPVLAGR